MFNMVFPNEIQIFTRSFHFKQMRVFKLAQSWKTMRVLLSIIVSTLGSLANLTAILLIIMFIFAAMGKQLFSVSKCPWFDFYSVKRLKGYLAPA